MRAVLANGNARGHCRIGCGDGQGNRAEMQRGTWLNEVIN